MHAVVEMRQFIRSCKVAKVSPEEVESIILYIARNPSAGDLISRTGGARKIRFAARGKGKSGGYRVVTFFSGPSIPVFLIDIFATGDKNELTQSERNNLKQVFAELVREYTRGPR